MLRSMRVLRSMCARLQVNIKPCVTYAVTMTVMQQVTMSMTQQVTGTGTKQLTGTEGIQQGQVASARCAGMHCETARRILGMRWEVQQQGKEQQ